MSIRNESTHEYYFGLANKLQLRFVSRENFDINPNLLEKNKCTDYLRLQAIPIAETATTITIATANPTTSNRDKITEFWSKIP